MALDDESTDLDLQLDPAVKDEKKTWTIEGGCLIIRQGQVEIDYSSLIYSSGEFFVRNNYNYYITVTLPTGIRFNVPPTGYTSFPLQSSAALLPWLMEHSRDPGKICEETKITQAETSPDIVRLINETREMRKIFGNEV